MSTERVRRIGRRDFVERSLCAVAGTPAALSLLSLFGCASLVTRTIVPENGMLRLALVHYPELTAPGGSLKVVPAGGVDPIYVLALDTGNFAALSPVCTHLGCTVDIQGSRLVCPCHGSTYDRAGRVLEGPAERSLARYATQITADGVLLIDLGSRT